VNDWQQPRRKESTTMNKWQSSNWFMALQIGVIGGIAAILMSLVGMVEEFAKRDIVAGVIEMGQTLILIALLATGYFAARRSPSTRSFLRIIEGGVAGATAGLLLWLMVQSIAPLDLRTIFLNASPALIKILTFGREGVAALGLMLALGALGGLAGALIQILPRRYSNATVQGLAWVALLGLLQDLIRVTLLNLPTIGDALQWMFGSRNQKGLSILGAVVVFVVVAGVSVLRSGQSSQLQDRLRALPLASQRAVRWISLALLAALILYLPNLLGSYLSQVSNQVGLFILMGLGLNIVVGFAGLLDLGYVAFFAIGAYIMGVLTTNAIGPQAGQIVYGPQMTFWQALPIAVLVSVLAGVILGIPVLNIRGDYLAIVTLGFGEIIRILAGSDFLKPYIGGSQGIVQVAKSNIGGIDFHSPQRLYYLLVAGILLAAFISWRLRDSRVGRAWKALREDEDVAQAMGIHLVSTKLMAFATGAAFAGLSGAIFASQIGSIYPHSFKLLVSINVLALIIVGGMGSLPGVFVGGLILVGLPELLREFSEYRLLIYGVLLIVMMLTRPEGFLPEATRRQELHEEIGPEGELLPETPSLQDETNPAS
jgi:branched-chain amino acid transport system permease protein